jgi:hypothetical protein
VNYNLDKDAALDWLFTGSVGISSETICAAFLGKPSRRGGGTPSDPDDLNRCRMFLECLSAEGRREALQAVSRRFMDWIPLVREWDSLCALMDEEAPNWRKGKGAAPRTFHAMKLLEVEGLKLRYPEAEFHLHADGTLSSMWNKSRSGPENGAASSRPSSPEANAKE